MVDCKENYKFGLGVKALIHPSSHYFVQRKWLMFETSGDINLDQFLFGNDVCVQ